MVHERLGPHATHASVLQQPETLFGDGKVDIDDIWTRIYVSGIGGEQKGGYKVALTITSDFRELELLIQRLFRHLVGDFGADQLPGIATWFPPGTGTDNLRHVKADENASRTSQPEKAAGLEL